jgi:hypothetical protein
VIKKKDNNWVRGWEAENRSTKTEQGLGHKKIKSKGARGAKRNNSAPLGAFDPLRRCVFLGSFE